MLTLFIALVLALLSLLAVVVPALLLVVGLLRHARRQQLRKALVDAGLDDAGPYLHGSIDGVRVYARVAGRHGHVEIAGPSLPASCPTLRPPRLGDTLGQARGGDLLTPVPVHTGDRGFDEHVHAEHIDANVGLGYLTAGARNAARALVRRGGHTTHGRWMVSLPVGTDQSLSRVVRDVAAASAAFAEPPGANVRECLEILSGDDDPLVRIQALCALHDRKELRRHVVDRQAHAPFPDVQLVVLQLAGAQALHVARRMLAGGSRTLRARAAIVLADVVKRHALILDHEDEAAFLRELVAALAHPELAETAADVLRALDRPDVVVRIQHGFKGELPPVAAQLLREQGERHGLGGGVALVDHRAGQLSVAC